MSGTAKVMDASMTMFKLYFGAVLGMTISRLFWQPVEFVPTELVPQWTAWLAVLILSLSLVIVFKARKRHAFWGVSIWIYCFFSQLLGSRLFRCCALGAFAGAFAIGVYSNLFARFLKAPCHSSNVARLSCFSARV